MSFRYDRPHPRPMQLPYLDTDNVVRLYSTAHNANSYTTDPDFWSDPASPSGYIEGVEVLSAYLWCLLLKRAKYVPGAFPVLGGGAQYDRVTW